MSDRRILAASAVFITVAIFLFLLGTYPSWKEAVGHGMAWHSEAPPAPASTPEPVHPLFPAAGKKVDATPVPAVRAGVPQDAPADSAASETQGSPKATLPADGHKVASRPSFDIVRVEPTGDSVVAARAEPGATILLLDQGRVIARAQTDASGQAAFVPPLLAPGEHSLMLSVGEPDTPGALSSQSVAVSVPDRANKIAPLVALLQPDQPTKLLGGPVPSAQGSAASPSPAVSVGAIDVEEMGSVFATGRATPGSQCRIYLNGSFVAGVTAGHDGTWSLKIQRGMRPGHYSVRVDELASQAGDVRARAEVPFDYPARAAGTMSLLRPKKGQAALRVPALAPASPVAAEQSETAVRSAEGALPKSNQVGAGDATAVPSAANATVVAQLLTTRVSHGDSLWRISRKMLGHGRRYTQIYAANTAQIRDPRLIYPGQIFVMPQMP